MVPALYLLTGVVAYAAMYHFWHWRGLPTERLHFWAGEAYRLPDLDQERGVVTYLGLPIQSGAEVLGVLVIGAEQSRTWTAQEIEVLSSFADQTAVALTNAHLYEAEAAARAEAEDALAQVRTLRGLLPICAWCKRVRNDQNYWEQIESYVSTHSSATFTHGICPQCRAKMLSP